jgi:AraC-like DNA-binding protein
MPNSSDFAASLPTIAPGTWYRQSFSDPIVGEESEWRTLSEAQVPESPEIRVAITRWHSFGSQPQEFRANTADDCHIVKIVLRSMNICLSVAGRTIHDGVALPGTIHVSEPGSSVRCLFRGPYDVLHLYVPNNLVLQCAGDRAAAPAATLSSGNSLSQDATVEGLARALLGADSIGGSLGRRYADCLSVAIVARLLTTARRSVTSERSRIPELARWRLKRAIEYVEGRLSEPVRLAEIASATGLTRMHFAAQFRAATGLRPHEYLLRRRIERAQEMLLGGGMPLVHVALSVGFQTQAHFTGVFKRFVGEPPRAWLRSQACTSMLPQTQELTDDAEPHAEV